MICIITTWQILTNAYLDCNKNNIGAFKILLVHSPEIIKEAERCGYHFYLCGHTHGGQICIPGIGAVISNANCRRKFISGDWKYYKMQGYTHIGTGASCLPVRFNCPAGNCYSQID